MIMYAIQKRYGIVPGLTIKGNDIIDWPYEDPKPTPQEIATWVAEDSADTAYIHKRRAAYPYFGDQLDMMYWDSVNGTTTWLDTITAIKALYPKPEE